MPPFYTGRGSGGAARTLVYQHGAYPMRGRAAVLILPAAAGDAKSLDFHAAWFYGAPATTFQTSTRHGWSEGIFMREKLASHSRSTNNVGNWVNNYQPTGYVAATWAVGILNRTTGSGWTLEYNPATRALSFIEYAYTGSGADRAPNIYSLFVLAQ